MILSFSIFVSAQTDADKISEWKTLAPDSEEFTIEMPVFAATGQFKQRMIDETDSRFYSTQAGGAYFYAISDNVKNSLQIRMVRNFIILNDAAGTRSTLGDYQIEKYVFSENQTYYHTILLVQSKNRVYAFQALSPTQKNESVEKFFQSLKLKSGSGFAGIPEPTEKIIPNRTLRQTFGIGSGKGSGQGSGQGNGIGNGAGTSLSNQTTPGADPDKETRGVMILTKPRANYTDYARFYDITSKVVLRVTFSANGKIGAISVISGLPFGLTEQAIAAARGITFKPALREGVPYSVTKPVEYSFIIY